MKNNENLISLPALLETDYGNIDEAEVSEVVFKIIRMNKKLTEIRNK